jgi:O-antigen/teichoic acid export membrane protein
VATEPKCYGGRRVTTDVTTEALRDTAIARHVFHSAAANYVAKFIALGSAFVLTPFILHSIGRTDFGLWALSGSVTGYGWLLDLGISGAIIKYLAEHRTKAEPDQANRLVATSIVLYTGLGLLTVVLTIPAAVLCPSLFHLPSSQHATLTWVILLMGLGIGLGIPSTTTSSVLQGLQRFDLVNLVNIASTLVSVAAIVTVLVLGGGLVGLVAINVPLTLAAQMARIWILHRVAPEIRFGWRGSSRSLVRKLISFSVSTFVLQVAGRVQTETDVIVIGANLTVASVAPYALARGISGAAQTLAVQFIRVLLPLASELHTQDDWNRLQAVYVAGCRLTLAIYLPVGATCVLLGGPILRAWVGAPYARYSYLVVILTIAGALDITLWPSGYILQGMAQHHLLAKISAISALVNLGLSLVLVHRFGLLGVALGTLVPTAIESVVIVLPYTLRVLRVPPSVLLHNAYLPAMMPIIPMTLILGLLEHVVPTGSLPLLAMIAGTGLVVYGASYLTFGARGAERHMYQMMVQSAVHFARTRLE